MSILCSLSTGGFSGGNGPLISLGGSPLDTGSGIAKSIRTPANLNGVYGLFPLPRRLPGHAAEKMSGDSIIIPMCGPFL